MKFGTHWSKEVFGTSVLQKLVSSLWADSICKLTLATRHLRGLIKSHSCRGEEGLHLTLQSSHMWSVSNVINTFKLQRAPLIYCESVPLKGQTLLPIPNKCVRNFFLFFFEVELFPYITRDNITFMNDASESSGSRGNEGNLTSLFTHTHTEPCYCVPPDLTLSLHVNSKYCSLAVRGNSKPWCFSGVFGGLSGKVCVCVSVCVCVCGWVGGGGGRERERRLT